MKSVAHEVTDLMKALSNENRLMILCQLVEKERSVGELAATLKLKPAALSQQLALLRKDRLVHRRRDGQTMYYSLIRRDVRALLEVLYELHCRPRRKRRI